MIVTTWVKMYYWCWKRAREAVLRRKPKIFLREIWQRGLTILSYKPYKISTLTIKITSHLSILKTIIMLSQGVEVRQRLLIPQLVRSFPLHAQPIITFYQPHHHRLWMLKGKIAVLKCWICTWIVWGIWGSKNIEHMKLIYNET